MWLIVHIVIDIFLKLQNKYIQFMNSPKQKKSKDISRRHSSTMEEILRW
jgi:hypothetical protein